VRVVAVGLGPIGRAALDALVVRSTSDVVGVVDPAFAGELMHGRRVAKNAGQYSAANADVAVLATGSKLAETADDVVALLEAGLNVVSTCEELTYPWLSAGEEARRIDETATRCQRSVIATGVNPGFVMDVLPAVLAANALNRRAVTVTRSVDLGQRRERLREKLGVGWTVDSWNREGGSEHFGHVGLLESAYLCALGLGWRPQESAFRREPIVTAGVVVGIREYADLIAHEGREIHLRLLFQVDGEDEDRVDVDADPPLRFVAPGGLHGDGATVARVVHATEMIRELQAGLRLPLDLAVMAVTQENNANGGRDNTRPVRMGKAAAPREAPQRADMHQQPHGQTGGWDLSEAAEEIEVGLLQLTCPVGDVDRNVAQAEEAISSAAKGGCDLVVLPEFFNTGYFPIYWEPSQIRLAEPADGPTITRMQKIAAQTGTAVVACIYEVAGPGMYYDTAFLIDRTGALVGRYRKTHSPARLSLEKIYFRPAASYPVFRFGRWTIGIAICYDAYFPEAPRALAVAGAEIILMPFADVALPLWQELFQVRAFENLVYVAECNMVGSEGVEREMRFGGRSMIVGPLGDVLATGSPDAECVVRAVLDRSALYAARAQRHLWRDRNPRAYGILADDQEPTEDMAQSLTVEKEKR
jgi:predicted amidohydrolase